MGGDSKFLRPISFGKNPKIGFYRLNPYSVSEKPNHFKKSLTLYETCCFEMNIFAKRKTKENEPASHFSEKALTAHREAGVFQTRFFSSTVNLRLHWG